MKNVLLFILSFFTIHCLFADGSENIENFNVGTSGNNTGSYIGEVGGTWNYTGVHSSIVAFTISGTKSMVFGKSFVGTRELIGESGADGVGDLSFSIRSYFSGGVPEDRTLEIFVAGISQGTITLSAMGVVENHTISDIAEEGNVEIKFVSTGPESLVIDDITWTCLPSSLPVTLTSFSARESDNSVALNWQTATEENNEYFSIEHSRNGRNYEEIGQVNGAGTTIDRQNYSFTHKSPMTGIHYYRLQQFDFNGQSSYSAVEVVTIKADQPIRIFPTQAVEQITIEFDETSKEEIFVSVYDVMGRMVLFKSLDGAVIENNINILNLEKGHYFLEVKKRNETYTKRFIKTATF